MRSSLIYLARFALVVRTSEMSEDAYRNKADVAERKFQVIQDTNVYGGHRCVVYYLQRSDNLVGWITVRTYDILQEAIDDGRRLALIERAFLAGPTLVWSSDERI